MPVEEDAKFPRATIITTTIRPAISPYSIAVAPDRHLTMSRISSNMIGPHLSGWLRAIPIFHKNLNKNFQDRAPMQKNPTLLPVVAAALVRGDGAILLQKRPEGRSMAGFWEFPGGKIEAGETPEAALVRELDEELAIAVDPANLVPSCFASAALGDQSLLLLLYLCRDWQGEPRPVESPEIEWFSLAAMRDLQMPPADLPLLDLLERLL
jgi:8-oxo-dGTP diphosphatase